MVMPNAVKIFPRGYSGGQSQYKLRYSTRGGDVEITELWDRYTSPQNHSNTWSFQRRVIKAAKRLLSSTPNWFIAQDTNEYLDKYNYEFIIDTIRFIGTGRRRMGVYTWRELVSNKPTKYKYDAEERHDIAELFSRLKLTSSASALIQMWCSHPNGFDDMMNTLNILFGDLPVRDESSSSQ